MDIQYGDYITTNELNKLKELNEETNVKKTNINNQDILNISLKELFDNWIFIIKNVIDELSIFIRDFNTYFIEVDNRSERIQMIITDFINIFIKLNRPMYVGFTIIFFAILIQSLFN